MPTEPSLGAMPAEIIRLIANQLVFADIHGVWRLRGISNTFKVAIEDDIVLHQPKDSLKQGGNLMIAISTHSNSDNKTRNLNYTHSFDSSVKCCSAIRHLWLTLALFASIGSLYLMLSLTYRNYINFPFFVAKTKIVAVSSKPLHLYIGSMHRCFIQTPLRLEQLIDGEFR